MKEEYKKSYLFFKYLLMMPFKLWYNPKIIGINNIPKTGALIICSNHRHSMDQCPMIISTNRMIHYLAKKEFFDGKFSCFFKLTGCIPVNRNMKDLKAKEGAIKLLEQGYVIGIFPEGTRNKTGTNLLPFKYGAVSIAQKTNAYILPVGISGDYKFRSKNLVVRIGKPFKVGNTSLEEANIKLKEEISTLLN